MQATIVVDLVMIKETTIERHAATEITQDLLVRDEADAILLPEDEIHLQEREGPETTPDQEPHPDAESRP